MPMLRRVPLHVWLLAPALAFVAAMALFPLGYSLLLSFRSWKLAQQDTPGQWLGLDNYWNLLSDDPEFLDSVWATLVFVRQTWG